MLLCPIENTAVFDVKWLQKRPRVSQWFGENPQIYKQFGHLGHNGIDFPLVVGTPLFSPFEGRVKSVGDQGGSGYGKYVVLVKDGVEVTLAHLSSVLVTKGQRVLMGEPIAESGNSGFSTGPHLHLTMKFLDSSGSVMDRDNGYNGAVNPRHYLINWKGTFGKYSLTENYDATS